MDGPHPIAGRRRAASVDAGPAADGSAGGASEDARGETHLLDCGGLLCEDFETGAVDPNKWDISIGGGGTMVATEGKDVTLPAGTILRVRMDTPPEIR